MANTTLERPQPLPRTGITLAPDGRKFTWGPIDKVHAVGEYQIVEYREDTSTFGHTSWHHHGRTLFQPYIDGRDTGRAFLSLDSALVGVIAYKRQGPNAQAAEYFDLMTLGVIPGHEEG